MKMRCTLLAVTDLEASKRFYCDLLGMEVTADFGANVTLSDCLALQTVGTWTQFIHKREQDIQFGNQACELYFEADDMEKFLERLDTIRDLSFVHPLKEHAWGQKVIRIYDPDRHIIEIGESMSKVARRFLESGMDIPQIAKRMDIQEEYVQMYLDQSPDIE